MRSGSVSESKARPTIWPCLARMRGEGDAVRAQESTLVTVRSYGVTRWPVAVNYACISPPTAEPGLILVKTDTIAVPRALGKNNGPEVKDAE